MASEKAMKVAEEMTRDFGGAGYYKDSGVLAGFLQNRFGSAPERAARVAAAVLDDLRGAAYYKDAGVLADYLDGQFDAPGMSLNKQTIQKYMDAFSLTDHAEILSCLTDDVEWLIPGAFQVAGKQAFDAQIENDAFVGRPTIRVTRMIEENGVVVAEGAHKKRFTAA